jgi:hypothetical protein
MHFFMNETVHSLLRCGVRRANSLTQTLLDSDKHHSNNNNNNIPCILQLRTLVHSHTLIILSLFCRTTTCIAGYALSRVFVASKPKFILETLTGIWNGQVWLSIVVTVIISICFGFLIENLIICSIFRSPYYWISSQE